MESDSTAAIVEALPRKNGIQPINTIETRREQEHDVWSVPSKVRHNCLKIIAIVRVFNKENSALIAVLFDI